MLSSPIISPAGLTPKSNTTTAPMIVSRPLYLCLAVLLFGSTVARPATVGSESTYVTLQRRTRASSNLIELQVTKLHDKHKTDDPVKLYWGFFTEAQRLQRISGLHKQNSHQNAQLFTSQAEGMMAEAQKIQNAHPEIRDWSEPVK